MNDAINPTQGSASLGKAQVTGTTTDALPGQRSRLAAARDAVGAFFGAILGLVPHVLHHIGLIAGAAFVTGGGGNALFFLIGLIFSIPLLRRLYRRFSTWRAPAIAIATFTVLFSLSVYVIGPAITAGSTSENGPQPPAPTQNHSEHHNG